MPTLHDLFQSVELPEILGVDFSKMGHAEIAKLLPSFGGEHPAKAILIDKQTGKGYGIASGWDPDTIEHNGISFKSGAITPEVAAEAGCPWRILSNHVEPVAAAFMRRIRNPGSIALH